MQKIIIRVEHVALHFSILFSVTVFHFILDGKHLSQRVTLLTVLVNLPGSLSSLNAQVPSQSSFQHRFMTPSLPCHPVP